MTQIQHRHTQSDGLDTVSHSTSQSLREWQHCTLSDLPHRAGVLACVVLLLLRESYTRPVPPPQTSIPRGSFAPTRVKGKVSLSKVRAGASHGLTCPPCCLTQSLPPPPPHQTLFSTSPPTTESRPHLPPMLLDPVSTSPQPPSHGLTCPPCCLTQATISSEEAS